MTGHRIGRDRDYTGMSKTKRHYKQKMLLPKFIGVAKSPELPSKHKKLMKGRPKSSKISKSKNFRRYALTKVGTVDFRRKGAFQVKKTERKLLRRSFELPKSLVKATRNSTPKYKSDHKLLWVTSTKGRQKSSVNISLIKHKKKSRAK